MSLPDDLGDLAILLAGIALVLLGLANAVGALILAKGN